MDRELKLHRIDPYRVELVRSGNMRTNGIIYADEALMAHADDAVQQVANVACLPGIVGSSMAMPDVHWGYGFPIGGVAAFDPGEGGVISPGGVGYDINCGVRLYTTSLSFEDVEGRLDSLAAAIFSEVPSGLGAVRKDLKQTHSMLHQVLSKGASWAVSQGYGRKEDLRRIENGGMLDADPEMVSKKAMERGKGQLGTLGSGNHFVELGRVTEIGDAEAAGAFGLREGGITLLLHTGSRGLGHQVATDYIQVMQKASRKYGISLPDRQLCSAPIESEEGRRYLLAMGAAANFAFANRQIISFHMGEALCRVLKESEQGLGLRLLYDVCHNIAKMERHEVQGEKRLLCVHRKGATRALPPGHPDLSDEHRAIGQPVLVPGDMGRSSYVLAGNDKAMELTFASCCHGAGRRMSRSQALKVAAGRKLVQELADKGIAVKAASHRTVAEEMPEAYKDVSLVVRAVEGAGIARIVARLEPLAVVKG